MIHWLIKSIGYRVVGCSSTQLLVCLVVGCLAAYLFGFIVGHLFTDDQSLGCLVVDCWLLVPGLVSCLIHSVTWLLDCLAVWFLDWVVTWLVGC